MSFWKTTNGKIVLGVAGVGAGIGITAMGLAWYIKRRRTTHFADLSRAIDYIDELTRPHVHMKNPDKVNSILTNMIDGGKENLQVIADFDRTISKYAENGKLVPTCYTAFQETHLLPESFREQSQKVYDIYHPIELDSKLTMAEKIPYMVEWWSKANELLLQCNITRDTIAEIVKENKISLRDRSSHMFAQLNKHSVPFLVFSAGLGDIIEEVFKQEGKLYPNTKIISNYMDFNHQGTAVGFKGELIHTFNKNESAIHQSDYFSQLKDRENVILLGDSSGDPKMADGTNAKNLLKIGFLNMNVEELLPVYLDIYDIVLVSDESMDICNAILKHIL